VKEVCVVRRLWTSVGSLVVATALLLQPLTVPAYAGNYPSWTDVLNARHNVSAKKKAIAQLQAILADLTAKAEAAQAEAERLGTIYQEAQDAFDEAAFKADQLQGQADEAEKTASASRIRAGQFVSELARVGSINVSTSLLSDAGGASDLLSKLGFASIIASQADGIYQVALQDQNAAQSLTDQANVAKDIREELRAKAQDAFDAAQSAADRASAALDEQQKHEATLKAQLATLISNQKHTEAEYQKGLEESGNSLGSDAPAGWISSEGWAKPAGGYISSGYGMRYHPVFHVYKLHTGTDLSNPCGSPIYSAREGRVVFSAWGGAYGNYIKIDHGDGWSTAYAHIKTGTVRVHVGDNVSTGTLIAQVGTTGASTGCHLHFEVRHNGVTQDPVPFMRDHGVTLG
jgi:murein DD-endopeptidase MepM/ murein hydrolase activator NlpD